MRGDTKDWLNLHPETSVLVIVEGHSAIQTGELVYSSPKNDTLKYAGVKDVSILNSVFLSSTSIFIYHQILEICIGHMLYKKLIVDNPGTKGLIAVVCGYAFKFGSSSDGYKKLVQM